MPAGVTLAHLRFPVSESRGRRYPELPHPYRSEFQRDRDRIVHARAFRRLEDKTQVFAGGISDHFRNRLTHTIEVSQMARTVAGALGLDEDLTEALALVHDVGHPPFAHAGEEELDRQMKRFGDRFDHNVHALRIVERFEQRYAAFPGLNLTFEVREGIVKHSRDFTSEELPELAEYLPGLKPPLEAQLIDLADEAAYNTADLDDAFRASLITMEDVGCAVPRFAQVREEIETSYPAASEREVFQEVVRRLIDEIVTGLIEGTAGAARDVGSVEEVRRSAERLARFTPAAAALSAQLKGFLKERVYASAAVAVDRDRSAAWIGDLFEHYLAHPDALPPAFAEQARDIPLHRVICDYLAAMTDGYLERTWRQVIR